MIIVVLKNTKNDGAHETIAVNGEYCFYTDEYFNIGSCDNDDDTPEVCARFNREEIVGYYFIRRHG